MLPKEWQDAYHILAHIKQSLAEVQDLQQALGVGITQPQHCPPKQQVKAGHSCLGNVRQLHQQQVCCLDMPSEVRAEQQLPAEIDIGLSPCTSLLQRQQFHLKAPGMVFRSKHRLECDICEQHINRTDLNPCCTIQVNEALLQ